MGLIPDNVLPYVEAIGADRAADLFLVFGGTEVYFPQKGPRPRTALVQTIGTKAALALGKVFMGDRVRLPLANRFLTRHLRSKDWGITAIARRLHIADTSVRRHLREQSTENSE